MTIAIKHLLVGFLALWAACGLASGWNDFARDIGHGFRLWKASSFDVCISRVGHFGAVVCSDKVNGSNGPVSGYAFTDEHLLVRTHGAKPSEIYTGFSTDTDREHFFIITKEIIDPLHYSAIGPLDRDEFYDNPAVPADIQWERPTRFDLSSRNEGERSALESIIITTIAWTVAFLIVFGPIIMWPIIIVFVVRWILRRRRMKSPDNN